jgi:hypothetical protein
VVLIVAVVLLTTLAAFGVYAHWNAANNRERLAEALSAKRRLCHSGLLLLHGDIQHAEHIARKETDEPALSSGHAGWIATVFEYCSGRREMRLRKATPRALGEEPLDPAVELLRVSRELRDALGVDTSALPP